MITINKTMITLLTIFLVSCPGPQIKPRLMCDISFQFNRCRCRCYDLEKLKETEPEKCGIDSENKKWNEEIEFCEGISGFYLEDIATHIIPKIKEKKQYIKDECGIE